MSVAKLQSAMKTFLEGKELISDASSDVPMPIRVIGEYVMESESMLLAAVGKDSGLCLFIHSPAAEVKHPDVPGPVHDPGIVVVSVFETPDVNQTEIGMRIPAVRLAEAVERLLHLETMTGFDAPLIALGYRSVEDPEYARFDVPFQTIVPLSTDEPTRAELRS